MFCLDDHQLNDEQKAAITAVGNVFLVACPGSGKTRTLTFKIAKELTELQSEKQFVVAITYTHRAADEIHERIEKLGIDTARLWIGTIHAFCLEWILKPYAVYHPQLRYGFRVIDEYDKECLLTELCKPYSYPKISFHDCEYYFAKGKCVLACTDRRKKGSIQAILGEYFRTLEKNRQIDFELLLFYAHELTKSHPSVSVLLSNLFSRILIDEYQDTKDIQYSIVASILKAGKGRTGVFIVGDPNQAIYMSLGGFAITAAQFNAVAGIDLKEMPLSRNYRSSGRIVDYFGNYAVYPAAIEPAAQAKDYPSFITYDTTTSKLQIEDELVRLIRYNVETAGIPPHEICVLAPWWIHLASMTRKLVARLPEYAFNGPGMVPFARDPQNFWYKVSRIALTEPSPSMYVTRLRWAGEILSDLGNAGVDISALTRKRVLREANSVQLGEADGLAYLRRFFDLLFSALGLEFQSHQHLREHHDAFFESSQERITRLMKEGSESISDISAFRRVFAPRTGITVSTIHGVKGAEYDAVIAYALLEGVVPHFRDENPEASARKMLYVICSRARKNLHLISETGRVNGIREVYQPTQQLANCAFTYDRLP